MSIDIRAFLGADDLQRALSSAGREEMASEMTRRVPVLACERCLCLTTITENGTARCGGCLRAVEGG